MMNNLPLRLTTLHFAQRLRMDGETFISAFPLQFDTLCVYTGSYDYTRLWRFRPEIGAAFGVTGQSG